MLNYLVILLMIFVVIGFYIIYREVTKLNTEINNLKLDVIKQSETSNEKIINTINYSTNKIKSSTNETLKQLNINLLNNQPITKIINPNHFTETESDFRNDIRYLSETKDNIVHKHDKSYYLSHDDILRSPTIGGVNNSENVSQKKSKDKKSKSTSTSTLTESTYVSLYNSKDTTSQLYDQLTDFRQMASMPHILQFCFADLDKNTKTYSKDLKNKIVLCESTDLIDKDDDDALIEHDNSKIETYIETKIEEQCNHQNINETQIEEQCNLQNIDENKNESINETKIEEQNNHSNNIDDKHDIDTFEKKDEPNKHIECQKIEVIDDKNLGSVNIDNLNMNLNVDVNNDNVESKSEDIKNENNNILDVDNIELHDDEVESKGSTIESLKGDTITIGKSNLKLNIMNDKTTRSIGSINESLKDDNITIGTKSNVLLNTQNDQTGYEKINYENLREPGSYTLETLKRIAKYHTIKLTNEKGKLMRKEELYNKIKDILKQKQNKI